MTENMCVWGETSFLIFSENVGELVYYTHISALVVSLFLGVHILLNNPRGLKNRVLFLFSVLFSLWIYFDLILWASPTPETVMFFWSAIVPLELLMYLSVLYLVYLFTHNVQDVPFKLKLLYSLTLLPLLIFGHTKISVTGLAADCDTGAYEGVLIQYMYLVEIFIIATIIFFVTRIYKNLKSQNDRSRALFIGVAAVILLGFFTAGNLTLTFGLGPYYEQFKLFGMPIFGIIVSYAILKFEAFRVKTILSDFLIAGLWILLFSTLLFNDFTNARYVIMASTVLFAVLGLQLSRSVRKEVSQREEIQKLAIGLEKANGRLKELDKQKSEFVSIASHQLRSPLTAMRGYASMMVEGSYGPITDKQHQVLEQIINSGKMMASSIEDYLSISRIESGNMKYEMSEFNLKDLTQNLVEELQAEATKVGLILHFASELHREGVVNADKGKVYQIIHNLVNNSLKYTPKGTVTVLVKDDEVAKNIMVQISDTGIGMNQATIEKLFEKFSRAENANSVNIKGTGLGLYVARSLANAMGGEVSAASEGDGKGSTFTFSISYIR